MAYEKIGWKARKGTDLSRHVKEQETARSVILHNAPTQVTEPGTPFSVQNMNHMDEGIYDAHEGLAAEVGERVAADRAHNENSAAHMDIRQIITNLKQELGEKITDDIGSHDTSGAAHDDIRQEIADTDQNLSRQIQETNVVLDGVNILQLDGDLLTRVINKPSLVQKSLFVLGTVFVEGKTLIGDRNGTVGVYAGDFDSATIEVLTKTIAPIAPNEPTLLGAVQTNAELPLTLNAATAKGWHTPRVDDYARVRSDETQGDVAVEWYISSIDDNGNIEWANPMPINVGDYQEQTTSADAGKVLTGGATPGTHGPSIPIDIEPTADSNNLVKSGGIFAWFGDKVSTLATTAKTVVGAINELFNNTVKLSGAQTIAGVKTFSSIPVLPASNPTTNNQATRKTYVDDKVAALFNMIYPVGSSFLQFPCDLSPTDREFPGTWKKWNDIADVYGLVSTANYPTTSAYSETATSIGAGLYRTVTFDGPEDQAIFQIREAHSGSAIGVFDPVKWKPLSENDNTALRPIFVERKDITQLANWTTASLAIGATATYNGTSYRVVARHTIGGKFPSFGSRYYRKFGTTGVLDAENNNATVANAAGGNRPPFITGGVDNDKQRIHKHQLLHFGTGAETNLYNWKNNNGYYGRSYRTSDSVWASDLVSNNDDTSTGPENSPRTLSVQYWRRVS